MGWGTKGRLDLLRGQGTRALFASAVGATFAFVGAMVASALFPEAGFLGLSVPSVAAALVGGGSSLSLLYRAPRPLDESPRASEEFPAVEMPSAEVSAASRPTSRRPAKPAGLPRAPALQLSPMSSASA